MVLLTFISKTFSEAIHVYSYQILLCQSLNFKGPFFDKPKYVANYFWDYFSRINDFLLFKAFKGIQQTAFAKQKP